MGIYIGVGVILIFIVYVFSYIVNGYRIEIKIFIVICVYLLFFIYS